MVRLAVITEGGGGVGNTPYCKEPSALKVAQYAIRFLQLLLLIDNGVLQIVAIVASPAVIDIACGWSRKRWEEFQRKRGRLIVKQRGS